MKIKTQNKNGIVDNAFMRYGKQSFSLFINTTHRNVEPCYRHSEKNKMEFVFYCEGGETFDSVAIIAENEKDNEILNYLVFNLHCKDQLWFLFLHDEIYEHKTDDEICPICGGEGDIISERQARCVDGCSDICNHCNGMGKQHD